MRITTIAPAVPRPARPSAPRAHALTERAGDHELGVEMEEQIEIDIEIEINDPRATWRDLWHAAWLATASGVGRACPGPAAPDPPAHVLVGGRSLALDAVMDPGLLGPGAVVTFGPRSNAARAAAGLGTNASDAPCRVRIVGGLDAGWVVPLGTGTHVVGRSPACAVQLSSSTVSRRHLLLDVTSEGARQVTDLGATNGVRAGSTFVRTAPVVTGQLLTLGATGIVLDDPPRREGPPAKPPAAPHTTLRTHNRPPRLRRPAPEVVVHVPHEAHGIVGRTPFSWAMVLTPLAVGGLMAVLFSPVFAVFALLSPVMMLASWFEQRRRGARARRRASRSHLAQQAQFVRDLNDACRAHERWLEHAVPDLSTVVARVTEPDPRLWERRQDHDDFGRLRVGRSSRPWSPPLDVDVAALTPDTRTVLAEHARVHDAAEVIEAGPGCIIGVCGPSPITRAVARSLVVQATVHHGPADLWTSLATTEDRVEQWATLSWLPHHSSSPAPDITACCTTEAQVRALIDVLHADGPASSGAGGLVVIDTVGPTTAPTPSAASFNALAEAASGGSAVIVLADAAHLLPASCTTIVECIDADGSARLVDPAAGTCRDDVVLDGLSESLARATARRLARIVDPLAQHGAGSLPRSVAFHEALRTGPDASDPTKPTRLADGAPAGVPLDANEIIGRWRRHREGPGLPAIVGLDAHGPHIIDLVTDGPHALVGGTTGSGKSELLRTWVLSLACTHAPDTLSFVLIDYKGGSAFDGCGGLPHVVGVVTDLDDELASRARRSLEAEIRHRERRLREAGVANIDALRHEPAGGAALPRLVVIVDEFATLASDVPGFLDALVDIAQRGRSLGVHLVLATQRPHGAVSDNIRTNTNLRIALRMLDARDSIDVIGTAAATAIDRRIPGRVCSATGAEPPILWQAAHLSSGAATEAGDEATTAAVTCQVLDAFGRPRRVPPQPAGGGSTGVIEGRDLHHADPLPALVERVGDAFVTSGLPPPRRPWLPPLPRSIPVEALHAGGAPRRRDTGQSDLAGATAAAVLAPIPLGCTDEPDVPRQRVWRWSPAAGPLVLYGMPGSGKTTAVRTVIEGIARAHPTDDCHVYVLGTAAPELAALEGWPQVGAIITPDERPRVARLLRWLEHQRQERATTPVAAAPARARGAQVGAAPIPTPHAPAIVVIVDGVAALTHALDDLDGRRALATFFRLASEGPRLGLHLVVTGERPQAVPASLAAATEAKIVLRLPDPYDYSLLGIRAPLVPPPAGRGLLADGTELQIAHVDAPAARPSPAPGDLGGGTRLPVAIRELPAVVALDELAPATADRDTWTLPLGLDDATLGTRPLTLTAGDHVLVAGPAQSGRTTTLLTLGCAFEYASLGRVLVLAPRANALRAAFPGAATTGTALFEQLANEVAAQRERPARVLVLIDDADLIEDARLERLITDDDPGRRVVVAGRGDRLRRAYTHWSRPLRDSRFGVALDGAATNDGDLWNVRLPATAGGTAGRAALIHDGHVDIVQVAQP